MKKILIVLLIPAIAFIISCTGKTADNKSSDKDDIIIENNDFRLVITKDGITKSLVHKPTNTECLIEGKRIPVSTITEPRPFQNEIKLAYPTKKTTFKSNSVRKRGDKLVISYDLIPSDAIVSVKTAPDYIVFTIDSFRLNIPKYGISMTEPPISEMWFLQLPVKDRGHFGDWLNVIWDDKIAVNLLATDPHTNANAEEGEGYHLLQAGVDVNVKLTGTGAALITCPTDKLLDKIAVVEKDFNLPHGVESRRGKLYNASYYWNFEITPLTADQHIKYAKQGGFRNMLIYYPAFLESRGYRLIGNYDNWRKEYPNGKADLKAMLDKIQAAGITPGVHFLHSHIGRDSKYVTPVPDHRLNLLRIFTLSKPLTKTDTTIYVEQNPANCDMAQNRRVLKLGTELISYRAYTTTPPYQFTGCIRGIDETTINAQPVGYMFGLLDVSEFGATSVYIDQNSDLQDEIADKIANIWDAGFRFFYFDGSEGVNAPFWYHVAGAQWRVFRKLNPEPLFAEGAAKTHFSWHMLTGGNAFDVFRPEVLKKETARHPLKEAPRMRDNFTRINFGWLGYWVPDGKTVGTQPDMLEYVTSKAASWDCPIAIHASLSTFDKHPRTADNLEVIRRWEEVRAQKWLTDDQKKMLHDADKEYILLINEKNEFELVPYTQVKNVANDSTQVRAFTFIRNNDSYAVFWHISANKRIEVPIDPEKVVLMENLGQEMKAEKGRNEGTTILPASNRHYIKVSGIAEEKLAEAFKNARILE
jgi:hypothetical protein